MEIKKILIVAGLVLSSVVFGQGKSQGPMAMLHSDTKGTEKVQEPKMVNDLEQLFSIEEQTQLEELLTNYKEATDTQIILISVDSIEDFFDFDQYSLHLIDKMEVERKIEGSGIVLVFSSNLRKIHLNTEFTKGGGLEDSVYEQIVREVLIPQFKTGNHYAGLEQGVEAIKQAHLQTSKP